MNVHAVIVNYRTPELARRCVQTIIESDDKVAITVVDTGGPTPETFSAINVPTIYMANVGYAAALNEGFRRSIGTASILVALNADTEWPTGGIGPLLELFDQHPQLGILGPRQVTPDGRIAHAGIERAGDTSGGRGFGEQAAGQLMETYLHMEQVSGSVMLIRRECFDAIGGIPKTRLYFEDTAACVLARRAGWHVAYSARATFQHHIAASPQPDGTSRAALARESLARYQELVA